MEKVVIDRRIGVAIIFLIILLILNNIIGFFLYPLLFDSPDIYTDYVFRQHIISIGVFLITFLGRIVIAIWLNLEAKRLHRKRSIWTMFGLFFGLSAALLFYIIEIYNEIILLRKNVKRIKR